MAHSHPVLDMDKHFIIDPITRIVTNAESKKTLLMQNDHNSERFSFEIDKIVEGHDMTLCNKVEVHYTNFDANKKNFNPGVYEVDDVEISADDPNKLIFTWLVSQNATVYNGTLQFIVVFACVEGDEVTYRWSSGMNNSIAIAKGLNNGEAIEDAYPDILTQWKTDLFAAVYGMETLHVGPTEPETYPYIWIDTSEYTGTPDKDVGKLTIKDVDGNKRVIYPFTKLIATDAANLRNELTELVNKKIDKTSIANNLTTEDEGFVLDARQGKILDESKLGYGNLANTLDMVEEGYALDARQGTILKNLINGKSVSWQTLVTLDVSSWIVDGEEYIQTITVDGVTEDCAVVVSPEPGNFKEYSIATVFASSQIGDQIVFTASKIPEIDLVVQLLIVTIGDNSSIGGGTVGGVATTAERLQTPRIIAIDGEASGKTLFDGSENVTIHTSIDRITNAELEGLLK